MLEQSGTQTQQSQPTKTHKSYNPYTEEVQKETMLQTEEQAVSVLEDSHKAFQNWRATSFEKRVKILFAMAENLRENKEELAELMSDEMGKLFTEGLGEVELCAAICEHAAEAGPEYLADQKKEFEKGYAFVSYQPTGVILSIQPWNFPLYQVIRCSAPNILAGNTMVLKHAPNVWGMAEKIEELYLESGLPENVFKSIYVEDETVAALIEHPYTRGVTMTGSDKAGSAVASQAGKMLKKCVLELGGSDPYIVLKGADVKRAAEACAQGRLNNAGQVCTAVKRMIVVEEVYENFKKALVRAMTEASTGNPKDKSTKLAPLARKDLLDKLNHQVQESLDQGAKCVIGGHVESKTGYFFEATILEDLKPGMPAYDEELFGPVASLIKAKNKDDAIAIANSSRYGLGSGIFAESLEEGKEIARQSIDAGMVNVDGYALAYPDLPFGGIKDSGFGREHGRYAFHEFINAKTVMVHENAES